MYEIKLKRDDNNLEIIPSHTVLVSLVTCVLISSSYDNNKKLSSSSPERYCTCRQLLRFVRTVYPLHWGIAITPAVYDRCLQ